MELLLIAAGGCSGMDVISILQKKRQDVTGLEINVSGQKAEEYPKKFTEITVEFIVKGKTDRRVCGKTCGRTFDDEILLGKGHA